MVQLKQRYEIQLKESNDNTLQWRTEAGVLSKQIDNITYKCEQLTNEQAIFLDEHTKMKKIISQQEQNLAELQRDFDIKTNLVDEKDKCLMLAMEKNQTLEKMKMFLNQRIVELEAQIEPRDIEIREMALKILEMEKMRINDFRNMDKLKIEIRGLNDRCQAVTNELKLEQQKLFQANTLIERIRSDIFNMIQNVQHLPKFKECAMQLWRT